MKDSEHDYAEKPLVAPESEAPEKHAGGRPTVYDPAMLEAVLLSAAEGATWEAIAKACGIDRTTAIDWCDAESPRFNPEYSDSVKRARDAANEAMLTSLYKSGIGYGYKEDAVAPGIGVVKVEKVKHGDVGAMKSWLANRIGWTGETQNLNVNTDVRVVDNVPDPDA